MLEAVLVSNDGGTLTSTLINLSEVSVLEGTNNFITCTTTNNYIYIDLVVYKIMVDFFNYTQHSDVVFLTSSLEGVLIQS